MDSQQIVSSLNRINSAIGVSWSNAIVALASHAVHGTERLSVALLAGVVVVSARPQSRLEREMRATVWHLWMTVIVNAVLAAARRGASSFLEQLTWSTIVLLAAEQFHAIGIVGESAHTFLVSTKYLFAESLSSAYADMGIGDPLLAAAVLFMLYLATQVYSPSPTVSNAVGLMTFDALGDILLASAVFPVNKITLALALSLLGPRAGAFSDHLREYSRWEASREIIELSTGREYYAAMVCFVLLVAIERMRADRVLREAVHDIAMLAFFDLFLRQSTALIQHVFLSNVLVPFLFSLLALAVARTRATTQ